MESFNNLLFYLKSKDVSPHTLKSYKSDIAKFNKWYAHTTGEEAELTAIGPLDIVEFKRYLMPRSKPKG